MSELNGKHIAILSTNGFEQSELLQPKTDLENAGAKVSVVSLSQDPIKGWKDGNWGESVDVDMLLEDAKVDDFDALVLPGGQINPDLLRAEPSALQFVKDFHATGKPLAAVCHAPWMLIEADIVKGRRVTSYGSIATDLKNAGAHWEDSEVVVDNGLITSRKPADLDAFCAKIIEEIQEQQHAGA